MKPAMYRLLIASRRVLWTGIVVFMVALHNFYKGDNQTPESIGQKTEIRAIQDDAAPK